MIKNAIILDDKDTSGVSLNNTVKVRFVEEGVGEDSWDEEVYKIVTSIRADSMKNKVSIESPLGKALLGKNVNEQVKVLLENGSGYELKIIEIDKTPDSTSAKLDLIISNLQKNNSYITQQFFEDMTLQSENNDLRQRMQILYKRR